MSSVSIYDVARVAGVSISTASRALNRTGRVSEETIKKVGEVAARLGYQPDAIARTMRSSQSHAVGIIVSDISNPFYGRLIKSLEETFAENGYALFVASSNNNLEKEVELIRFFKSRKVDGLILGPCQTDSALHIVSELQSIATVLFDRDAGKQLSTVKVDHYNGTLDAVSHLLKQGHKRIALMTPGSQIQPIRDRLQAYQDGLLREGVPFDPALICFADSSMNFPPEKASALLQLEAPPTAFLCLGTRILAGVLSAIKKHGLEIPKDVSVLSIGDSDFSALHSPSITALAWDIDNLSREISSMLLQNMRSKESTVQAEVVEMQLVVRESCGEPSAITAT